MLRELSHRAMQRFHIISTFLLVTVYSLLFPQQVVAWRTENKRCTCGLSDVTLSRACQKREFGPNYDAFDFKYCSGLKCTWKVTMPPNAFLALNILGELRHLHYPGRLSRDFGDFLKVTDSSTQEVLYMYAFPSYKKKSYSTNLYHFSKNVTIRFSSSDLAPYQYHGGMILFTVTYVSLPSIGNTKQMFNAWDGPVVFRRKQLFFPLTSITFSKTHELSYQRLFVHPVNEFQDNGRRSDVIVLDGNLMKFTKWTTLDELKRSAYQGALQRERFQPFTSSTGEITIIAMGNLRDVVGWDAGEEQLVLFYL
ncbi:hypothetical protein QR680_014474 [Steinernema hermaphroditum]|uniref:CUB domain-containing protein n=1 Tax=Steinernema hermaphroditum TaxID=289476 RepID=A0AA39I905_9BILA|nr:hypothetical protein QR680_014474 [Steinernema hermaphroditum]